MTLSGDQGKYHTKRIDAQVWEATRCVVVQGLETRILQQSTTGLRLVVAVAEPAVDSMFLDGREGCVQPLLQAPDPPNIEPLPAFRAETTAAMSPQEQANAPTLAAHVMKATKDRLAR
jgi:hypothetical protein